MIVRDDALLLSNPQILAALAFCAGVGALQGTIITRLGIPSFVVTKGGEHVFLPGIGGLRWLAEGCR